jgi:hypothetical protein
MTETKSETPAPVLATEPTKTEAQVAAPAIDPAIIAKEVAKALQAERQAQAAQTRENKKAEAEAEKAATNPAYAEIQRLRAEIAAEKQAAKEAQAYHQLTAELSGKVRPEATKLILSALKADKALNVDADGNPYLNFNGSPYGLSEGIQAYLADPQNAWLRPAPQAQPNLSKAPRIPVGASVNANDASPENLRAWLRSTGNGFN